MDTTLKRYIQRRDFLALCGTGALTSLLASCATSQPPVADATAAATARPTATPSPTQPPTLTENDWQHLTKNLHGTLVRPGNSQYADAIQLFNPRFDSIHPAAVAYCSSPADVQACLAFAQRFRLPLTPRAGGHSYAGYSTTTGIVIDVTRMNTVTANLQGKTATIGAGARLIDVYTTLAAQGLALPAGSCPTVGIAGLTLGGGVGVLDRKFGLTCDNLQSAQVVLADGRQVTCDASQNSDLFWALRGGGGGNFGVVTEFTFQVYPLSNLTLFTLQWPWANAADVVDAWQNWGPQAPDEVWSSCLLEAPADKGNGPIVQINGVYIGTTTAINGLLQPLLDKIPVAPISRYVSEVSLLDAMLYEAGCSNKSSDACHLPTQNPQGQLSRDTYAAKSDYYAKLLPRAGIDALINAVATRHSSSTLGEGGIGMDAFGGAINRVAASATAFVHRNALFSAQYDGSWTPDSTNTAANANSAWLNATWQAMHPYSNGEAYQNYIDPELSNWQQAYYGSNLQRLQNVKQSYDPHNLFHFAQSIAPTA